MNLIGGCMPLKAVTTVSFLVRNRLRYMWNQDVKHGIRLTVALPVTACHHQNLNSHAIHNVEKPDLGNKSTVLYSTSTRKCTNRLLKNYEDKSTIL